MKTDIGVVNRIIGRRVRERRRALGMSQQELGKEALHAKMLDFKIGYPIAIVATIALVVSEVWLWSLI